MSVSSHNFTFPLDVYEPFSSPTFPKLRIATLNARSVCKKSAVISVYILFNKLDIICLTETWINMMNFLNHLPHPYFLQIILCLNIMKGLVLCMVVALPSSVINLSIIHSTSIIINSLLSVLIEFESLPEHHVTSNVDLIFVGDINIHLYKQDDPNTDVFNRLLLNFNLN